MQFAPQRSVRSNHIVIAIVAGFAVFVTVTLVFIGRGFGISMFVVSILLLIMIIMETSKLGWSYWVDEDGIRIKRTFKRYRIPADEVESVKSIDWNRAEKILQRVKNGESTAGSHGSGGGTGRMQRQVEMGRIIGYSSLPVPIPGSRSSPARELRRSKGSGTEIFVSVKRNNGRHYLLTPRDTKGFVKACRKHGMGKT